MPTENENLQRVLEHLDKVHQKVDEVHASHKEIKSRLDALEGEREKERADKARADAEEKERKEREEKEKVDAAARAAANPALAKKLADIERGAAVLSLSETERAAFAEAQMRADAAYGAWSKSAPHGLHGEALQDYRIRLLRPLQQHSKRYKDSALHLIGDEAVFSAVENAIINDAVEASCDPAQLGSTLREIKSTLPTGHVMTKFVGDPAVTWGPMMGGATKFGRINPHRARQ